MLSDSLYSLRFPERDRPGRDAVWRVLCRQFFQRYVGRDATVLDLGAGFGEFLRYIECRHRIAVDILGQPGRQLPPNTDEVIASSIELSSHVAANSIDVVFCSNFFEHLPDTAAFLATLREIHTVLKPGGRLLAVQPNIRLVGGAYWDFVDHHLPLTDRTLVEAARESAFDVIEVIPRFLPYTTRSAIPQSPWLVRLYLTVRPAWWVLGKQTWFVAGKPPTVR